MNSKSRAEEASGSISLANAVFCVDCETISNSPHDVCTVCGGHSLIGLFRVLGGTLRSQKSQPTGDRARYSLELTAKVHEIPAPELNLLLELLTRLAEAGGAVEALHVNLEAVTGPQDARRAA